MPVRSSTPHSEHTICWGLCQVDHYQAVTMMFEI